MGEHGMSQHVRIHALISVCAHALTLNRTILREVTRKSGGMALGTQLLPEVRSGSSRNYAD